MEALSPAPRGHGEGCRLLSGPGWGVQSLWEGFAPRLCARARGVSPGQTLVTGLAALSAVSVLPASTPSSPCWAPRRLFQAPGGDSTIWPDGARPLPPGPPAHPVALPASTTHAMWGRWPQAGQPPRALLPQPLPGAPEPAALQRAGQAWPGGAATAPQQPPPTPTERLGRSAARWALGVRPPGGQGLCSGSATLPAGSPSPGFCPRCHAHPPLGGGAHGMAGMAASRPPGPPTPRVWATCPGLGSQSPLMTVA